MSLLFSERIKKIFKFLASTELAVTLFLLIAVVAIPGTIIDNRATYSSPPFLILIALFSLNLVLCTWRRFSSISKPVLVVHSGILLTLLGCIVASFGFVATVNLYEGSTIDHVYRWDREAEVPLGVSMELNKINWEFYPMPVKIGILRSGNKEKLFELKTGESFDLNGYTVTVGSAQNNAENLALSVFEKGNFIGKYNTLSGLSDLPSGFPYAFKLVAFKTPKLKRLWVDLILRDSTGVVAKGTSEVNGPFQWGGLYFFNTQVDRDKDGVTYAGIQIVRDPGRWIVFSGMVIVGIGALLATFRRWHGFR